MTGDTWGRKSCTGAADPWTHSWAHTPADRRNQTGQTQKAPFLFPAMTVRSSQTQPDAKGFGELETAGSERFGVDYRTAARCSIRSLPAVDGRGEGAMGGTSRTGTRSASACREVARVSRGYLAVALVWNQSSAGACRAVVVAQFLDGVVNPLRHLALPAQSFE